MEQTNNDCRFQIFIYTGNVCLLEDKIQDWGMHLFTISYGNFALDQRSGRWSIQWMILKSSSSVRGVQMPNFEVLDPRTASALNRIIHNSHFKRRVSLEETKMPQKETVSFVEDRSLTWSSSTSRSQKPTIPSRIMPTHSLLVFKVTIFRNSIQSGTEFYYQWQRFHLMTSWKDCTNREYESLKNSRPYWNCMTWRFIRRK